MGLSLAPIVIFLDNGMGGVEGCDTLIDNEAVLKEVGWRLGLFVADSSLL